MKLSSGQRDVSNDGRYSLDVGLASNLFDILHGFHCLFLRSASHVYFCIVFQQVLSGKFAKPSLYIDQISVNENVKKQTLAPVTIATLPERSGTSSGLKSELGTKNPIAVRSKEAMIVLSVVACRNADGSVCGKIADLSFLYR